MDFQVKESENIPTTDSLGEFDLAKHINKVFKFYKRSTSRQQLSSSTIEFSNSVFQSFELVPISMLHLEDEALINELKDLRNHFIEIYPNSARATTESTTNWIRTSVVENDNRILFLVLDKNQKVQGHLGIWMRDEKSIELDNVLKSPECKVKGLFSESVFELQRWINEIANISTLSLRVLGSNEHAKKFYENLGYEVLESTPMKWIITAEGLRDLVACRLDQANDSWVKMSRNLEEGINGSDLIPTAGPSITAFEISYVNDAVRTGWNNHHSDYLAKFSRVFGEYVGAKYVIPTDSCTSALHLGLWALGIGPGDEVIVPDLTWVATANAVKYVGAKPVFADIDSSTWCIDPESVRRLITSRTKAIIPVHLYGYVANLPEIEIIANEHAIYVLQDAAPGIGSSIGGRGVAEFGDFTAFSFQGAKLLVSGEGGVLTTNNPELYEKAFKISDVGRKPGTFWIEEFGKKIKMNNLTAALALGQMQSVERQIQKKKRIQEWYYEGLSSLTDLSFQTETKGTRSIAWMTSINLAKYDVDRDIIRENLKTLRIDTRPVFPAISTYPIWDQEYKGNPVSNFIGANSINLPSGVRLNRNTIEYICQQVTRVLQAK